VPSVDHRAIKVIAPSRDEALQQHRLILVAEDNEINQRVIRQQLELLGYAADVATTGREAFKRFQSGNYALLLTDLHMPEMDGYRLTLKIRVAEGGRTRIPIIALTANALRGESERCLAVGMDDYLSKPAPLTALAAVLGKWLPAADTKTLLDLSSVPVQVSVLEALVGTDPQLIKDFLQAFGASAGQLAVELTEAYGKQRSQDAAAIAHKLKSSSRSVGALKLAELCAAIEAAGTAGDLTKLTELVPDFEKEMAAVSGYLRSMQACDNAAEKRA
jgi:CheY-like chemotaxis protein/HPt (histidine-containing phosphotransfer) domain-containing protein